MYRYCDFIRFLAVLLTVVHALSEEHLLFGHIYCPHATLHSEVDCGHAHYQPLEKHSTTNDGSDEPCDHVWDDDELPVILIQRTVKLLEKPIQDFPIGSVSVASMVCHSDITGFLDAIAVRFSAFSLRLHLVYGVLLI